MRKNKDNDAKTTSARFDRAVAETFLINAMIQADSWDLNHFTQSPPWLQELYQRHAAAACNELKRLRDANLLTPPAS